ncbi:unnamed protein product [Lymnaea stagnalis]|uniref:Uncharacterized protein n=1 Tax=Lymnaea stagnalis TaxID=6523 RepID=A0AAV2HIX7_LYMST
MWILQLCLRVFLVQCICFVPRTLRRSVPSFSMMAMFWFVLHLDRSILWTSPTHNFPVYPDWHQFRHVAFLKDNGNCWLEGEDVWSDYLRRKHQEKACIGHPIGTLPTALPELKRNGHQRNLQQDPPMSMYLHPYFPWPKREANIPPARFPRGEYYSYYHDAFQSSRAAHHRLLPLNQRVQTHEIPHT